MYVLVLWIRDVELYMSNKEKMKENRCASVYTCGVCWCDDSDAKQVR